jgi:hypothetical protein
MKDQEGQLKPNTQLDEGLHTTLLAEQFEQ